MTFIGRGHSHPGMYMGTLLPAGCGPEQETPFLGVASPSYLSGLGYTSPSQRHFWTIQTLFIAPLLGVFHYWCHSHSSSLSALTEVITTLCFPLFLYHIHLYRTENLNSPYLQMLCDVSWVLQQAEPMWPLSHEAYSAARGGRQNKDQQIILFRK